MIWETRGLSVASMDSPYAKGIASQKEMSFDAFVQSLEHIELADKTDASFIIPIKFMLLDPEPAVDKSTGEIFLGRRIVNAVHVEMIQIDIDGGMTIQEFINQFKSLEFILVSSYRHLDGIKHKFHVYLPLREPMLAEAFRKSKASLVKMFPMADPVSFTLTQGFFKPSCPIGSKVDSVHYRNRGSWLDGSIFKQVEPAKINMVIDCDSITALELKQLHSLLCISEMVPGWYLDRAKHTQLIMGMRGVGCTVEDYCSIAMVLRPHGSIVQYASAWSAVSGVGSWGNLLTLNRFIKKSIHEHRIKTNQAKPQNPTDKFLGF